jgi:DNA-binding NarL/FixJ family response regulator
MSVKILIVDDHKLFREGLRALLEEEKNMQVVGEASEGRATLALCRQLKPDIVVMDVTMPDLNGIEATRQITAACPHVRVIGLSMHTEQRFVAEMLSAGAVGYLPKNADSDELLRAIRTVAKDQTYLSPVIAGEVIREFIRQRPAAASSALSPLTDREREVLQLLAEGKSMKEIAAVLNLSVKTVHTHRQKIMDKSNLRSVAELTKLAVQEGLTTL